MNFHNKNNKRFLTLDELTKEDKNILWDTCALSTPLSKDPRKLDPKKEFVEKIRCMEEIISFLKKYNQYIKEGCNFYITEKVKEEIYGEGAEDLLKYYKKLQVYNKKKGGYYSKKDLMVHRLIVKDLKEKKALVTNFEEKQRIITLNEEEQKTYDWVKSNYLGIEKKYNLEGADYDLLLSGLTKTLKNQPTILISNDHGILRARNKMIKNNHLVNEKIFQFYVRTDFFKFEKRYNYYY